jgi:hypothetical protein
MKSDISRRSLIKGMAAMAPALLPVAAATQSAEKPWYLGSGMPQESASTPKICLPVDLRSGITDEAIRGLVQIGVYHAFSTGPALPWTVEQLQPHFDKLEAGGIAQ